jgi:G3E family GTPase
MSRTEPRRVPVNIISGPLGVGKTTAINHLLALRPPEEKWAVLVNEYGQIGVDAALMVSTPLGPGVEVREVAGGCICCSAGVMFHVSLVLLLGTRPDRLLIEPTGLATLSGILDTLRLPGVREAVDLRTVICLTEPGWVRRADLSPEARDQLDAADVVLANRCDTASPADLDAFATWATEVFPAKRFTGTIEFGSIPLELLDCVQRRTIALHISSADAAPTAGVRTKGYVRQPQVLPQEPTDSEASVEADRPWIQRNHASSLATTVGWVVWDGVVFDAAMVRAWLRRVLSWPSVVRCKAVLHTSDGWWSFNGARGAEDVRPSAWRRDSRVELVFDAGERVDERGLDVELCTTVLVGLEAADRRG